MENVHADESTDSLIFAQKRKQILSTMPNERGTLILGAAEDLARDGFFAEALDLIYSLEDTVATAKLSEDFLSDTLSLGEIKNLESTSIKARALTGYLQSTGEYENWEFQDQPWGGRLKAKVDWIPHYPAIEKLTTVFQGSEHNVYFDFYQKATFFGRMLKIETEELVEKKIRQSYQDSLDRVYLNLWTEVNTRPLAKAISFAIPLRLVAEQFRSERTNALSSRQLWTQPRLEAVSDDLRKTLIMGWEARKNIYPSSAASNNYSQGPIAWGEWYGDRINVDAETHYLTYDYSRDTSLYRQNELETRIGFFVRTWHWLKVGVKSFGQSEMSLYNDSLDLTDGTLIQGSYNLKGSKWTLEPQLILEWLGTYSATIAVQYGRGKYPSVERVNDKTLLVPRSLQTPYEDWQPSLGFTFFAKSIFLNMSVDYQTNTVPADNLYNTASSRGVGMNANVFWKLNSWLELDFTCMLERKLSAAGTQGQIQNLTSLSLSLTSNF